jgi:3D (Asp-Asp-Asp) domain-containing protein
LNKRRAVAASAALLLTLLLGAGAHGKEADRLGEGIRTQTTGSPAQGIAADVQTKGRGAAYEKLYNWGRHRQSGSELFNRPSPEVSGSLGSRKEGKPGEPGILDSSPAAAGKNEAPGETSKPVLSSNGPTAGADYRGSFTITAYTAGYESTQKKPGQEGYGITYSGTTVKEGRTIAADLNVLPVGTRVYIEDVGERTVEDKGGAVNGNHIDLYIADLDEALEWGRQKKKVYVIEWGKKRND